LTYSECTTPSPPLFFLFSRSRVDADQSSSPLQHTSSPGIVPPVQSVAWVKSHPLTFTDSLGLPHFSFFRSAYIALLPVLASPFFGGGNSPPLLSKRAPSPHGSQNTLYPSPHQNLFFSEFSPPHGPFFFVLVHSPPPVFLTLPQKRSCGHMGLLIRMLCAILRTHTPLPSGQHHLLRPFFDPSRLFSRPPKHLGLEFPL